MGKAIAFYDADHQLHRWAMPMEMLKGSGEEIKGELLRLGLEIAGGNKARNLLMAYILNSHPTARARCINRTGWHDDVFVFPHQTIGNQENVRILSQVKAFFEAHAESQFSDWQAESSYTINRAGFRKVLNHEIQFYVLPEVFGQEICAGWDFHTVTQLLLVEGWIEPDLQGKAYRREYLPNIGRSRCYVFTNKMWA